jgi:hypothetical protein
MSGIGLLDGIHRKGTDSIGKFAVCGHEFIPR